MARTETGRTSGGGSHSNSTAIRTRRFSSIGRSRRSVEWAGSAGPARDVAMLRDMIGRLVREGLADPRRIYPAARLDRRQAGAPGRLRRAWRADRRLGDHRRGDAGRSGVLRAGRAGRLSGHRNGRRLTGRTRRRHGRGGRRRNPGDGCALAAVARFARLNACKGALPPCAVCGFSDPRRSRIDSVEQYLGCKAPVERIWVFGRRRRLPSRSEPNTIMAPGVWGKTDAGDGRLVWNFLKNLAIFESRCGDLVAHNGGKFETVMAFDDMQTGVEARTSPRLPLYRDWRGCNCRACRRRLAAGQSNVAGRRDDRCRGAD